MKVITNINEVEYFMASWIRLWQDDKWSTPFNHPGWILSYAKAFRFENYFILTAEDDKLTCIWSLQKVGDTLYFIGDPQADYSRPSISSSINEEFAIDVLFQGLAQISFSEILLRELRQDDPIAGLLMNKKKAHQFYGVIEKGYPCPRMFQEEGSNLFHQKFIKSRNQKRVLNLLKRNGDLTYQHIKTRSKITESLALFFLMHTSRWESIGKTLFMDPATRRFYKYLTETLPQHLIHFSLLKQGKNTIAINYDFVYENTLYWYKAAFDNRLKNQSPGLGLLCFIGRDINEQSFHTLDFTRGSEKWKMRFANQVTYTTNVYMSKNKLSVVGYQLKRRVKTFLLSKIRNKEKIQNKLALLRRSIDKYGWIGLIGHLSQKFLLKYLPTPDMLILQKDITKPFFHATCDTDNLEIVKGSYEHLFDIADLLNPINKVQYLKSLIKRLDDGDAVYLGFLRGELIYSLWLATDKESVYIREVNNDLPIKKDTVYIYNSFTAPQHRGHGIHKNALEYAMQQASIQKKCNHAVAVVLTSDKLSIRGFYKSGFTNVGMISKKSIQQ